MIQITLFSDIHLSFQINSKKKIKKIWIVLWKSKCQIWIISWKKTTITFKKKITIKKKIIYNALKLPCFLIWIWAFWKRRFCRWNYRKPFLERERERVPRGGRKGELSHRNLLKEQTNKQMAISVSLRNEWIGKINI